ncbi:MAG: NAD-dependent deacylase [Candidatus Latescibacterota bacterium]|jgi:NAD-dependent deacetylase
MSELEKAVELLKPVQSLVVSTGAGMSKESGIPTFRDAPSSLWANFNPEDLATPEGFRRDPPLVWRWYVERRRMIGQANPHPGHYAVAELEPMFERFLLVTQNIDDLHRKAGSRNIVEVHGNIFRYKCFDKNHPIEKLPETSEVPPRCHCGSMIRPDVVWFGERLDEDDLDRAFAGLSTCEAILVVGTSGMVYPAAGFPQAAKNLGAAVVEVNPEETAITNVADVFVKASAGEALPVLVERLKAAREA